MRLKSTDHRNIKILSDNEWGNEYRIHMNGNIFYRHVGGDYNWAPVIGIGARSDVWNKARTLDFRIHWREENDIDPVLAGFTRIPGNLAVWYVCDVCQIPFSDMPEHVLDAQEKGCDQPGCTNKIVAKE